MIYIYIYIHTYSIYKRWHIWHSSRSFVPCFQSRKNLTSAPLTISNSKVWFRSSGVHGKLISTPGVLLNRSHPSLVRYLGTSGESFITKCHLWNEIPLQTQLRHGIPLAWVLSLTLCFQIYNARIFPRTLSKFHILFLKTQPKKKTIFPLKTYFIKVPISPRGVSRALGYNLTLIYWTKNICTTLENRHLFSKIVLTVRIFLKFSLKSHIFFSARQKDKSYSMRLWYNNSIFD